MKYLILALALTFSSLSFANDGTLKCMANGKLILKQSFYRISPPPTETDADLYASKFTLTAKTKISFLNVDQQNSEEELILLGSKGNDYFVLRISALVLEEGDDMSWQRIEVGSGTLTHGKKNSTSVTVPVSCKRITSIAG